MLRFNKITGIDQSSDSTLTLTLDQRVKSRLRVTLDNGMEAGLFLPRGTVLQQGDILEAETGERVEVHAATETVSTVYVDDPLRMARACYHLGNRHVPLQVSVGFLRYKHDHVLDDMVSGLGLKVNVEQQTFEPEPGAYDGQATTNSHSHGR